MSPVTATPNQEAGCGARVKGGGVGEPRTIGLIDDFIIIMNSREKDVVWQDE